MALSNSYSFLVNRDQIIRAALIFGGKLEESEIPSAQEVTDCSMFLNMLVKQWQGKADFAPGLKSWTRRRGFLYLSGSTGSYLVGPTATGWTNNFLTTTTSGINLAGQPVINVISSSTMTVGDSIGVQVLNSSTLFWSTILNIASTAVTLSGNLPNDSAAGSVVYNYTTAAQNPVVIESALLRDSFGNDVPVRSMNVHEYDGLSAKNSPTNQSDPSFYYYEYQLSNSLLYTDVAGAQDVTKYLVLTYMEPEQDMNSATDNPAYPQEWYLPLALGLAKLISPVFNFPWNAVMESSYNTALAIAQKKEPENITSYFQCGEYV